MIACLLLASRLSASSRQPSYTCSYIEGDKGAVYVGKYYKNELRRKNEHSMIRA